MKESTHGMSGKTALRLEMAIIGLGILALVLIFQPFSITVFAIGSGLVVLAGLVNNLLPLVQPGVPARSVVVAALVVAMIFCVVLLVAITAAHLYGVFFLTLPDPATASGRAMAAAPKFYAHPLVWSVAAVAAVLAGILSAVTRKKDRRSTS
jgi:hypothetical protein